MIGLGTRTDKKTGGAKHLGPRLGFLGVGWIGQHRLKSIAAARQAEIAGLVDLDPGIVAAAALETPDADVGASLDELLQMDLDGLVIATPTALHAEQAIAALEAGLAVFCQKPLGRSESETRRIVAAAEKADRLLGVDMSYRFVRGVQKIQRLAEAGEIGEIYAMDLAFHNAYGPDKPWYYDPELSGGGCVIDLGIHLVDLALRMAGAPVAAVTGRLFAGGKPLGGEKNRLEDYATARLDFTSGATANLACSWRLPAGRDAVTGIRERGRIVLRFSRPALFRHGAADPRPPARPLGRPRGRGLGRAPGGEPPLRPRDRERRSSRRDHRRDLPREKLIAHRTVEIARAHTAAGENPPPGRASRQQNPFVRIGPS